MEVAERTKQVELVDARKAAERDAIAIEVKAEAEKRAATDQSEAVRTIAQAEADKQRIAAQGRAEAEVLQANAAERRYAVDAEGKRRAHEADNLLSDEQISMKVRLALVEHMPDIIRESVKPMERIDGIKIFQVDGLGGNGNGNGAPSASGGGNLADQIVNSALRYRAQAPLLDTLLGELGLDPSTVGGLTRPARRGLGRRRQGCLRRGWGRHAQGGPGVAGPTGQPTCRYATELGRFRYRSGRFRCEHAEHRHQASPSHHRRSSRPHGPRDRRRGRSRAGDSLRLPCAR